MTGLWDESGSRENDNQRKQNKKNLAVKRNRVTSRMTPKLTPKQSLQLLDQLRAENEMLEEKVQFLTKEIEFIRKLFMDQAGTSQILSP